MNVLRQTKLKRVIIILLVTAAGLILAGCASGLFPQFTYQGVLTDASGNPVEGDVRITYRIFNTASGGTAMYTENETVTVTDGRFDSVVGPQTAIGGLAPEDLAQPLWVELRIGNGTYTETLTPRQRLYGAPYAFTLMPGTVISSTMNEALFGAGGINAVTTIINKEPSDPIPALRVQGERGLELVDVSGSHGTIYSDLDAISSDLHIYSNDNIQMYLDYDSNESGTFYVYGSPLSNYCYITDLGNFLCTGTKSSITDVDDGQRALYAIESPDVWFEDFGSAQLANGTATVQVDPMFAQSVNLNVDYHVFLTPLGDCNGLYVSNKTADGFEVHELGGGISDVGFDYRIVAKRSGYEDVRMETVNMNGEGAE
jgi:hypothetical protein